MAKKPTKKGPAFNIKTPVFHRLSFWNTLAAEVRNQYREHIFNITNPRDVYNRRMKNSKAYSEQKAKNNFKNQDGSYKNSAAPVLTGDLYRDTQSYGDVKQQSIFIGWTTHSWKLDSLKERGKVLTAKDKPLPDKIVKNFQNTLHKELQRIMPGGKQIITISKK